MPMWNANMLFGFGGWLWMVCALLLSLALFAAMIWTMLSLMERRELRAQRVSRERRALLDDTRGDTLAPLARLQRRYALGEIDDTIYHCLRERHLEGEPEGEAVQQSERVLASQTRS